MSMQLTMNKKNIFHWIAMILIMAVFYVIPAVGPVTPYGMKILGVFVGLIMDGHSLECLPLVWLVLLL